MAPDGRGGEQRQAGRRAARQAARENTGAVPDAQRQVDAPPEELGQSGYTLEHTNEAEEFIGDLEIGDEPYPGDEDDNGTDTAVAGPRGVRGGREHEEQHREHGRVV